MATRVRPFVPRGEGGNALVEFALVLPLLMLVFAGIVDFGFLFQRYEVITNAAREGARLAVLPGYGTTDVQNRVRDYVSQGLGASAVANIANIAVDSVPVELSESTGFNATRVTVTFTSDYLLLGLIVNLATGGDFAQNITLHAISTMRPEVGS